MSHTPGPWSSHTDISGMRLIRGDGTRLITATVRSEEDARLIAAAPDLLEALQMIASMRGADSSKSMLGLAHVAYESFHIARAAIAKATGEKA